MSAEKLTFDPSLSLDPVGSGVSEEQSCLMCSSPAEADEIGGEEDQKAHSDVDMLGFCCDWKPR